MKKELVILVFTIVSCNAEKTCYPNIKVYRLTFFKNQLNML